MKEVWKKLVFNHKYEISNKGDFRSMSYSNRFGTFIRKKPLYIKKYRSKKGYVFAGFYHTSGKKTAMSISRLVLMTFRPNKFSKLLHAEHLDGNKLNNNLENLGWATPGENNRRKIEHGTMARGEKIWASKLNINKVKKIRKLSKILSQREIAKIFDISHSSVGIILNRDTWRHI